MSLLGFFFFNSPYSLTLVKKNTETPKKSEGLSFNLRNPQNPWKRKEKRSIKQGKLENGQKKQGKKKTRVGGFLTGVEMGKKSFVFWVVFLGLYLNTKEWKIREGGRNKGTGDDLSQIVVKCRMTLHDDHVGKVQTPPKHLLRHKK